MIHHPYAPFTAAASLAALLMALLAYALAWFWPAGFSADLAALLLAYALALGVLQLARRWPAPAVMLVALAAALGLGAWVGGLVAEYLRQHALLASRPPGRSQVYALLALCLLLLPGVVRRWQRWREEALLAAQAERHAAERTLLEAQLAALQGQIEPHFLFNTLANVQYLLRRDAPLADQMLARLLAYLRATLPEIRQVEVRLGEELERVRAYLDIMQIRMGERLAFQIACPPELEAAQLPPLALATLVENALKHGLEGKPGGGSVTITAVQADAQLQLSVADNGLGFHETGSRHGGVGLRNLRQRLLALYGAQGELVLEARPEGGVLATLCLPLVHAKDGV
ncbi:histidine kinase [Chitinimonas viridis]|uniref:Histidine kinase n=1 Tax=Chitinimonas viridis TaxID=664880 RepID=A0ABT8BAH0_9NEIS|nr:histidine kinase [Chitinimonas viridis]MDN3578606.1 histidine kinase [Chitinimonas viridis]